MIGRDAISSSSGRWRAQPQAELQVLLLLFLSLFYGEGNEQRAWRHRVRGRRDLIADALTDFLLERRLIADSEDSQAVLGSGILRKGDARQAGPECNE